MILYDPHNRFGRHVRDAHQRHFQMTNWHFSLPLCNRTLCFYGVLVLVDIISHQFAIVGSPLCDCKISTIYISVILCFRTYQT